MFNLLLLRVRVSIKQGVRTFSETYKKFSVPHSECNWEENKFEENVKLEQFYLYFVFRYFNS